MSELANRGAPASAGAPRYGDITGVPGLLKPAEAAALQLAATGGLVLEIGAAWGFSTILMAQVARSVVSIDPHDLWNTWPDFTRNLVRYGVQDRVSAYRFRSQDVLPQLARSRPCQWDLAFVDGDHGEASADHDIRWCLQLVRAGGILAVHDYSERWPGVVVAVKRHLRQYPAWRIQDLYLAAL